ncbi:DUF488 family protein [Paenibacillus sp. M1]|uniref:DUF488 family protein n=1 Tax=Paenibacillus haidiansis TaxID=1574488 RepID=A0ABU7VTE0_9BACL
MNPIRIKRIYEEEEPADGRRILVDRIWPRGVSKDKAAVDEWLKEIGPSHELRKWFGHKRENYEEFKDRYMKEVLESEERSRLLRQIRSWAEEGTVTLLYAAKDRECNQAVVLAELLSSL